MINFNKSNHELINSIADTIRFTGTVTSGFCREALTRMRAKDPKALDSYGYRVYSQNDEDGIIHEIFNRIGTTSKSFIEFGVQDGLESNTHLLLFYGWKGLWIEGSEDDCSEIAIKFNPVIKNGQLSVKNSFITRDNINSIFSEAGFTGEIDLLSIDIDGNDLYIWEAINEVNPRVVIIEYNGKLPPDVEWCQAYNAAHIWICPSDWHGASLKSLEILAKKKGYQLVGTNLRGVNAFFVRKDLVKDLFYEPSTAEALYNPLRLNLKFIVHHSAKYCLVGQKENYGLFNYYAYQLIDGFHSEQNYRGNKHVWTSQKNSTMELLIYAGVTCVHIPYSLPLEVLKQFDNYTVKIKTDKTDLKYYNITTTEGSFDLVFNQVIYRDTILKIEIEIPYLWCPSDLVQSSDTRTLGIKIGLSNIIQR